MCVSEMRVCLAYFADGVFASLCFVRFGLWWRSDVAGSDKQVYSERVHVTNGDDGNDGD